MNVRPARTDDVLSIANVHVRGWQAAYRGIVPDAYLDSLSVEQRARSWRAYRKQQPSSETWVANADPDVVGWVAFNDSRDTDASPGTGEIEALYVLPEHWSTGVGRALWLAAKARLIDRGFGRVTLWVLADNARAIRFYTAAGFAPSMQKNIEIGGKVLSEVRYEAVIV